MSHKHNQHLMFNLLNKMFILGTLYPKLTNKSISCFHLWGLDSTTLGWVFMGTLHFPMHRNSFPNIHWSFQLRIGHVTLIRHLLHHFIPDVKLANSMAMKKMRTLRRSPEFISGKQNFQIQFRSGLPTGIIGTCQIKKVSNLRIRYRGRNYFLYSIVV